MTSKSDGTGPAAGASGDGDRRLHLFYDGELSPDERASLEAQLDDADREKLSALDELGALLRGASSEDHGRDIEAFDAWRGIEARIAGGKVLSFGQRLRKIRIPLGISTLAAAAAAVLVLFGPFGGGASNACEIEEVEASGADVTVMRVGDDRNSHGGTTVVWVHETE